MITSLSITFVPCRCKWNGHICPSSSLSQRYTDMGMCISFNADSTIESYTGGMCVYV